MGTRCTTLHFPDFLNNFLAPKESVPLKDDDHNNIQNTHAANIYASLTGVNVGRMSIL